MKQLCLLTITLVMLIGCGSVQVVRDDQQSKTTQSSVSRVPVIKEKIDFGDMRSETLTTKAWTALSKDDYDAVVAYTGKCIKMFAKTAKKQQKSLKYFASKEKAFNYWALNDVGTCYFINACMYEKQNKIKEQKKEYKIIVENYYFCQCWDPNGWFWHPGEVAEEKLIEWNIPYSKETVLK